MAPNIEFSINDLHVVFVYFLILMSIGTYYYVKGRHTTEEFAIADRQFGTWSIALTLLASYVSSLAFFSIPGKCFSHDWRLLASFISFPLSAFVAIKYVIPFFRSKSDISGYAHLGRRFGKWASIYASIAFSLKAIVYTAVILYIFATVIGSIFGFNGKWVMLATGAVVMIYTCMGGLKSVIATDVLQAYMLILGAIICLVLVLVKLPGSIGAVIDIGMANSKFNLGNFSFNLSERTFWVYLISTFCGNIAGLSINQGIIQRYYAAKSETAAKNGLLIASFLMVFLLCIFMFLGTSLFAYYNTSGNIIPEGILAIGSDAVVPYFMFSEAPVVIKGFLLTAVLAAGMSSIDTNINAAAVTLFNEIFRPFATKWRVTEMDLLYKLSFAVGIAATAIALLIPPQDSIIDLWFDLSSIIYGGVFGLFIISLVSRKITNTSAIYATLIGTLVMAWIGISAFMPNFPDNFKAPFHSLLGEIVGSFTIVVLGFVFTGLVSKIRRS